MPTSALSPPAFARAGFGRAWRAARRGWHCAARHRAAPRRDCDRRCGSARPASLHGRPKTAFCEPDPIERGKDATTDCRLLRRADHSNRPRLKQCFKLHRLPLCRSNDATVHGSAQGEYCFERAASGDRGCGRDSRYCADQATRKKTAIRGVSRAWGLAPTPESQVRIRLPAGGSEIRTLGPP